MKHLFIIGGGSAAATAAFKSHAAGWKVTLANDGLPIGGTCLNVGCVPSKFFIRAAQVVHESKHPRYAAIAPAPRTVDWPTLVREKQALVDELRERNFEQALPRLENLEWVRGRARFTDAHTVQVGDRSWTPDFVLIATGAWTLMPPVDGLAETPYLTNETIYDLSALPASLIVLGGGYIALEVAQMFQRFGTDVTVIQRSEHILSDQSPDVTTPLRERLEAEGLQVETNTRLSHIGHDAEQGFTATWSRDGVRHETRAEALFVGTGRRPNTADLGLEAAGIAVGSREEIPVGPHGETTHPHIYAAGDVIGDAQFVYTASTEADIALDHMLGQSVAGRTYDSLPWVVFTDPQVAGVGIDADEARKRGIPCETAELPVNRWPRFRVTQDLHGFLRLFRNPETDELLGARALTPEAGDLVTDLGRAMRHGITLSQLAQEYSPYLTLSEGITRAADRF